MLLGLAIYRLQIRRLSRDLSARFDERLTERTRVARDTHDTFLQTIQGSKMVADHALKDAGNHERLLRAMEQLSAWLGRATEEGHAALNSLQTPNGEPNDLAPALRRAIDECRTERQVEASLRVQGDTRETHPAVRDEIYRIAYEAIRNACVHSDGDRVEVSLEYGHDLTVRVSDNGIGIHADVVDAGQKDRVGLRAMRERAQRIDSALTITTAPRAGTTVTLTVPGRVIFRSARPTEKHR